MSRFVRMIGLLLATLVLAMAVVAVWSHANMEAAITAWRDRVTDIAAIMPSSRPDPGALAALPDSVRRYIAFTFPDGLPDPTTTVTVAMEGDFRRPGVTAFEPTTAHQVTAAGTPAFVFDATTPIVAGVWARVYDAFVDGEMDMKARILSTLTVVDYSGSPTLNQISLRRWLIESPLYPMALLPGGPVTWEPIDDRHARAVVSWGGMEADLIATFRDDGALVEFRTEEDGDLSTPYHGSGEVATRDDFRMVEGVRLPHAFSIARAANGETYPFWVGRVTNF
ncbi:DUF6920 family protein [Rhodospira trueperi]|uniref:Uncharacterized protein n=1 Tax=Rhodospira trueperi TaxID=69960 RepID=A0A1G7DSC5_9PROT|nr:DUF6544 family protein [Rhodospira trueperi]SDE54407.1 hypothetical protein SAMN05421720_1085 [Rhodospira trueperi]